MTSERIIAIVAGCIGVFVLFMAYQGLVVIPNERIEAQERMAEDKIKAEQRAALEKRLQYDQCISEAYSNYSADWDSQCVLVGKEADCSLLQYQYARIEERHTDAQERCVALYK